MVNSGSRMHHQSAYRSHRSFLKNMATLCQDRHSRSIANVKPDFSFLVHSCCRRVEYDASHCYHNTEYTVATDSTPGPDPTKSHDSNSLGMTYHSAGYWTCSSNDSELRKIEETCAKTTLLRLAYANKRSMRLCLPL